VSCSLTIVLIDLLMWYRYCENRFQCVYLLMCVRFVRFFHFSSNLLQRSRLTKKKPTFSRPRTTCSSHLQCNKGQRHAITIPRPNPVSHGNNFTLEFFARHSKLEICGFRESRPAPVCLCTHKYWSPQRTFKYL